MFVGGVPIVSSWGEDEVCGFYKVEMDNLTSQLRKEKGAVLAKDREIKELTLKVKNQDEAGELGAAENASLRS